MQQDRWARPDNELLPQTQEGWLTFWRARVAEWERVFAEEREYPTFSEQARRTAVQRYHICQNKLAEVQGEE